MARWMSAHPELALEEHEASARYRAWLSKLSFRVESPVAGWTPPSSRRTEAMRRRCASPCSPKWTRCPDRARLRAQLVGSRNAARRIRARGGASRQPRAPARGRLPGGRDRARQRRLVEAGAFADVDVALDGARRRDAARAPALPRQSQIRVPLRGRAAHAAAYPERGVNALDAVIAFFVALGCCASNSRAACACTASSATAQSAQHHPGARRRARVGARTRRGRTRGCRPARGRVVRGAPRPPAARCSR